MQSGLSNVIFVSWEDHRRTREICSALGIKLHTLVTSSRGLPRYLQLIPRTLRLLSQKRAHTVIVQNPSLVLSILAILVRRFFSLRVIMAAHNEAVLPYLTPHPVVLWATRWLHKRCDHVIVTNKHLADIVVSNGGRPLILPDRIPEPPAGEVPLPMRGPFNVVLIATFARDEPIGEVLKAAAQLGPEFQFYVTGNDRNLAVALREGKPVNVTFTGFLGELQYWSALRGADLVVDLTLIDNCLVCGAYEALAVGTPLVLSRNAASIDLFGGAARFADNSANSIAQAICEAKVSAAELRAQVHSVRERLRTMWEENAAIVRRQLVSNSPRPHGHSISAE
jgi:glycosyltransferase involved in cell wall biosynthesis